MREISLHGQNKRYHHRKIGLNGRLDTLQAAILIGKLSIFDVEVKARMKIGDRYTEQFKKNGFKKVPLSPQQIRVFMVNTPFKSIIETKLLKI